ncbi:MAG: GHKL domain-containing protein [Eubacteriales bacterium]
MNITYMLFTYIILSAAETWIGYRLFTTYLVRNNIKQTWYLLGAFGYFSFQLWSYVARCSLFSTAVYYLVFSTAISLAFFSDSIQNKFTISWMYVIMNYACKTTVIAIAIGYGHVFISNPNVTGGLVMDAVTQIAACILFVLCLAGTIGIRKLRVCKQFLLYATISYTFPLTMLYLAISAYNNFNNIHTASNLFNLYSYISALLFAATIALFYLLEKTMLLDINNEKSAVMEELLALQREHYGKLESTQRETQSLRHDIKHHIQYIQSLLAKELYQEAINYITKLYENNPCLKGTTYSGNIAIDSTLSHSFNNIQKKGIDLKYSIIVPPDIAIEDVDLCILFGNLVDNSVEACERLISSTVKKFITINANIKKDYLVVTIANSFNGKVDMNNNFYKTIKVNQRYCGIGLANIRKVVKKYNGELSLEHKDKVFTVAVMLSLHNVKD